jgi:transcriptional regulator with XRE-family HTH domain
MTKTSVIIAAMKNLAEIRKAKGLTQQQLGDLVGLDQATISKMERTERGYNYTAEAIHAIALVLKVEPAELFGLPELQKRVLRAISQIEDPARREAVLLVIEAMASKRT